MNELTTTPNPSGTAPAVFNRNQIGAAANVGAVAIEQERAIAEVQGQLILAKRFPRDLNAAYAELMESCSLQAMAQQAFYSVPNRGTGPSIRLAEEIARVFGNFEFGHRELSRGDGKSEVEVYAWDKQTNNRSIRQITVMHTVDTKQGPKVLRDQADIDNRIANVASKQVRGRILAMMPKWLVQDAVDKCKATLAGTTSEPISVRVRKMTQAFAQYGVSDKHLTDHLGHALDETTVDELVDLIGIFNAIKEGAKPSEFFGTEKEDAEASANIAAKLAGTAAKAGAAPRQRAARQPVNQPQAQPTKETPPAQEKGNLVQENSNTVEAAKPEATQEAAPPADAGESTEGSAPPDADLF